MKIGMTILAVVIIFLSIAFLYSWAYRSGLQGGLDHAKLNSYQAILQKLAYVKDLNSGKQPFPPEQAVLEFLQFDFEQYLHTETLNKVSGRLLRNIGTFARGEPSIFTVPWTDPGSTDEQLSKILDICRKAMKEENYQVHCAAPIQEYSAKWREY